MFEIRGKPLAYKGLTYHRSGEVCHVYMIDGARSSTPAVVKFPHVGMVANQVVYTLAGYLTQLDFSGIPVSGRTMLERETETMKAAESHGVSVPTIYANHAETHWLSEMLPDEVRQRPHIIMEFVEGKTYAEVLAECGLEEQQRAFHALGQELGKRHTHGPHYDPTPNNAIWNGRAATLIDMGFPYLRLAPKDHFEARDFALLFSEMIKRGHPADAYVRDVAPAVAANAAILLEGYRQTNPRWKEIVTKAATASPYFGARMCANARVATLERKRKIAFEMIARYNELQKEILLPWLDSKENAPVSPPDAHARRVAPLHEE